MSAKERARARLLQPGLRLLCVSLQEKGLGHPLPAYAMKRKEARDGGGREIPPSSLPLVAARVPLAARVQMNRRALLSSPHNRRACLRQGAHAPHPPWLQLCFLHRRLPLSRGNYLSASPASALIDGRDHVGWGKRRTPGRTLAPGAGGAGDGDALGWGSCRQRHSGLRRRCRRARPKPVPDPGGGAMVAAAPAAAAAMRKSFLVPEIKPLDQYDFSRARSAASLAWVLAKGYGGAGTNGGWRRGAVG